MPTIKEIAQATGVSPTTVSNVIHGRISKVSPKTLEKVQRALKEGNYVSNMGGRLLANHGSRIIGVIMQNARARELHKIQDPWFSEIIGALEQKIREAGYFMLLYTSENYEESLRLASMWRVEGIIAIGNHPDEVALFQAGTAVPIVFIDSYADKTVDVLNVGLQDFQGAYDMTSYLIQLGHRDMLFLGANSQWVGVDKERSEGFRAARTDAGLETTEKNFLHVSDKTEIRHDRLRKFVETSKKLPTALVCSSDYYAVDTMNLFFELGFSVPQDISITGFDNNILSAQSRPKLTTVNQEVAEKAHRSVQLLMSTIQGEEISEKRVVLPTQLIFRESVQKV
ncbi:MAG: LacI family transcriptional regulator [Lactobacillales bacterium]|jgi:LacI family transcriptional regulator|nr:LacI family transcriptional regulator [Lactobacillales bacterium]